MTGPILNDVSLSEPYRFHGVAYPVRMLSWCFCSSCGVYDEKLDKRWARRAEECADLLAASTRSPNQEIAWGGSYAVGHSDVMVALHRRLVADIETQRRRERAADDRQAAT
jgi:hypothetical protein